MRVVFVAIMCVLGLLALSPAQTAPATKTLDTPTGFGCRTTFMLLCIWLMLLILASFA